jgi:predicted O-methyltransferase YrrM
MPITTRRFEQVDQYVTRLFVPTDDALAAALAANEAAGLPSIAVSPAQGKLLQLLARSLGAGNILEIGTLGGYSTLWLAGALPPDGHLVTLEIDPEHARVAEENFIRAGLADRIELRLGPALESLPKLAAEGRGPFDLFFIDADKDNNPGYFAWALKLAHRGSLIIVDNVVRDGAVIDADSRDPGVQGTRKLLSLLAAEPRVSATVIQTVGQKGYDGFALALVIADA